MSMAIRLAKKVQLANGVIFRSVFQNPVTYAYAYGAISNNYALNNSISSILNWWTSVLYGNKHMLTL